MTCQQPIGHVLAGTYITGGFPLFVPPASGFFEHLDGSLILVGVCRHIDLGLFKLGLVLALLLTHDHVALGKIAFDPQTILFVFVAALVDVGGLLLFGLVQSLDPSLDNLPSLFHSTREGRQRFLQLGFHLLGD